MEHAAQHKFHVKTKIPHVQPTWLFGGVIALSVLCAGMLVFGLAFLNTNKWVTVGLFTGNLGCIVWGGLLLAKISPWAKTFFKWKKTPGASVVDWQKWLPDAHTRLIWILVGLGIFAAIFGWMVLEDFIFRPAQVRKNQTVTEGQ